MCAVVPFAPRFLTGLLEKETLDGNANTVNQPLIEVPRDIYSTLVASTPTNITFVP